MAMLYRRNQSHFGVMTRGQIVDGISTRERPTEVEDRAGTTYRALASMDFQLARYVYELHGLPFRFLPPTARRLDGLTLVCVQLPINAVTGQVEVSCASRTLRQKQALQ